MPRDKRSCFFYSPHPAPSSFKSYARDRGRQYPGGLLDSCERERRWLCTEKAGRASVCCDAGGGGGVVVKSGGTPLLRRLSANERSHSLGASWEDERPPPALRSRARLLRDSCRTRTGKGSRDGKNHGDVKRLYFFLISLSPLSIPSIIHLRASPPLFSSWMRRGGRTARDGAQGSAGFASEVFGRVFSERS